MRKPGVSTEEIISAIKATARRLKRTPTRSEFERLSGIHWTKVQRLFGGYRAAVREAGLQPDPGYVAWSQRNRSALIRIPLYKPGSEQATRAEIRY